MSSRSFLVAFLVIAIIGVFGLGAWLLLGGNRASETPPTAVTLGAFYMPGEYDPQDLLLVGGGQLAVEAPGVLTAVLQAVGGAVDIALLRDATADGSPLETILGTAGLDTLPVDVLGFRGVSMWVGDYGPFTLTDVQGRRSLAKFTPGLRRANRMDAEVADRLAHWLDLPLVGNRLQMEGGDLVTNGRGLGVLSTRVPEANVGFEDKDTAGIVKTVAAVLGLEQIVMVPPLDGEESGHVNRFCVFLAPDLAVVGRANAGSDPVNAARLDAIAEDLARAPTVDGPLRVERVPQPAPVEGASRSFTAIVVVNDVVLVPTFPDHCPDLDAKALAVYRRLLPDRRIVGIDASALSRLNATLRCVTVSIPVGGPLAAAAETGEES